MRGRLRERPVQGVEFGGPQDRLGSPEAGGRATRELSFEGPPRRQGARTPSTEASKAGFALLDAMSDRNAPGADVVVALSAKAGYAR